MREIRLPGKYFSVNDEFEFIFQSVQLFFCEIPPLSFLLSSKHLSFSYLSFSTDLKTSQSTMELLQHECFRYLKTFYYRLYVLQLKLLNVLPDSYSLHIFTVGMHDIVQIVLINYRPGTGTFYNIGYLLIIKL